MKRISFMVILAMMICLPAVMQGQINAVDKYFEEYRQDDRFTYVSVSGKMFGLFVNFEMDDPTEQEVVEAISKLKGFKMLAGEDVSEAPDMYKTMIKKPESNMEELMSVTESGKEFRFFITEKNGTISELFMIGYEEAQIMIMSLVGEIDLRQISRLSQKMNIDGFEHFNHIDHD